MRTSRVKIILLRTTQKLLQFSLFLSLSLSVSLFRLLFFLREIVERYLVKFFDDKNKVKVTATVVFLLAVRLFTLHIHC